MHYWLWIPAFKALKQPIIFLRWSPRSVLIGSPCGVELCGYDRSQRSLWALILYEWRHRVVNRCLASHSFGQQSSYWHSLDPALSTMARRCIEIMPSSCLTLLITRISIQYFSLFFFSFFWLFCFFIFLLFEFQIPVPAHHRWSVKDHWSICTP